MSLFVTAEILVIIECASC